MLLYRTPECCCWEYEESTMSRSWKYRYQKQYMLSEAVVGKMMCGSSKSVICHLSSTVHLSSIVHLPPANCHLPSVTCLLPSAICHRQACTVHLLPFPLAIIQLLFQSELWVFVGTDPTCATCGGRRKMDVTWQSENCVFWIMVVVVCCWVLFSLSKNY